MNILSKYKIKILSKLNFISNKNVAKSVINNIKCYEGNFYLMSNIHLTLNKYLNLTNKDTVSYERFISSIANYISDTKELSLKCVDNLNVSSINYIVNHTNNLSEYYIGHTHLVEILKEYSETFSAIFKNYHIDYRV